MKIYVRRPTAVVAWEWTESRNLFKEIGCIMSSCGGHTGMPDLMNKLSIRTINDGIKRVNKGDYIIQCFYGYDVMSKSKFFSLYNEAIRE